MEDEGCGPGRSNDLRDLMLANCLPIHLSFHSWRGNDIFTEVAETNFIENGDLLRSM